MHLTAPSGLEHNQVHSLPGQGEATAHQFHAMPGCFNTNIGPPQMHVLGCGVEFLEQLAGGCQIQILMAGVLRFFLVWVLKHKPVGV